MTEENKTAALLIIGNEILSGRTQDTNTPWLASALNETGVTLQEVRIVPDIEDAIAKAVNDLRAINDYVLTTGGIGPTHDDITSVSIAKAFGKEIVLNEGAYQSLLDYYGDEAEITTPRKKMAMMPEGAILIPNPVSGAAGFQIENVFVMAGVPRIMQAMFDHVKNLLTPGKPMLSHTLTCILQESEVAEPLQRLQTKYPDVVLGSYPQYRSGVLGLSLVIRATDKDLLTQVTSELIDLIESLGARANTLSIPANE